MLNQIQIIGRTGKDPEVRHTESGMTVAKFSVAVSEKFKDKSGEQREETEWFNCVAFGKLAEIIEKYVNKGDLLYLRGKLKTRSWDKDGEKKYMTETVIDEMKMLGGKKSGGKQDGKTHEIRSSSPDPNADLPF